MLCLSVSEHSDWLKNNFKTVIQNAEIEHSVNLSCDLKKKMLYTKCQLLDFYKTGKKLLHLF